MIRVAIIGLGRIGSAYDYAAADGRVHSHLGAVLKTPDLAIAALVDPDPERRAAAAGHWNLSPGLLHEEIECLPSELDAAVVCTPSADRLAIIRRLLAHCKIRLILVEKPLALTSQEAEQVASLAEQHHTVLRVNFQRRFSVKLAQLRRSFAGEVPRIIVARYGRGLLNYGSHLLDLFLDWFGPITEVSAIGRASIAEDPVLSFRCHFAAGFDAVVIGLDGTSYDQFDVELFFSERRVIVIAGGQEIWEQSGVADRFFPGYVHLGAPDPLHAGWHSDDLIQLWTAVRHHLAQNEPLGGCTVAEAVAGLRVLEAARQSAQNGGRAIILNR